jgi:hypothetical protein
MRDGYVFPATGQMVSDSLIARRSRGAYGTALNVRDFAVRLTNELRALTHDKHMSVSPPSTARTPSLSAPPRARGCPGGAVPNFMNLASYFVAPETIFGRLYSRQDNSETVFRTSKVKGPTYLDKPVFVLTDSITFSAAEAFAYHLQHEGRVRVVGDTSGGGAHRVRGVNVGEDFTLGLAYTRVINAKTGTDWEGVGVIPDIATRAAVADSVARVEAARTRPTSSQRR